MSETETLVRFYRDWHSDGEVSADGLPVYHDVVKITLARPPLLRLDRVAEEDDFEEYPQQYVLFLKEEKARTVSKEEGYPLDHWPACSASHVHMLAHKDVFTVEQLAKMATRRADPSIPPEIRDLAARAQSMIAMQKSGSKYEARVHDLEAQLAGMVEELKDARMIISNQAATIDSLRARAA
jgi:hypothetical protein